MLDFVILYHEMPTGSQRRSHWDLMLRDGDRLLTWALDVDPLSESTATGKRLPDHRLEYLLYEGPVSENRGRVSRIAGGSYRWLAQPKESTWQIEMLLSHVNANKTYKGEKLLINCCDDKDFKIERLGP